MNPERRAPAPRNPYAIAVLTLALGCFRGGMTPGVGQPVAAPNPQLLLRGIVPCLDATVARVDQLHAAGAPFAGAELRTMLLARLDLPEGVLKMVDTSKPIGFALVERPGLPAALATALAPTGSNVALFAGTLGTKLLQQSDVSEVQLPDGGGSVWVRTTADAAIVGASREDVTIAGDDAATARALATSGAEDVVVTGYPVAIARAQGIDLSLGQEATVRQLLAKYDAGFVAAGRPAPVVERAALEGALAVLARPLPETETFEAGVALGAERGLALAVRLRPRAGTPFAQRVAARTRWELPAQLASGGDALSLAALGAGVPLLELVQSTLDAQARAQVKGAVEAAARARALFAQLTGDVAFALRPAKTALAYDLVLPLAPGADPAATLEAFSALAASAGLAELLRASYGGGAPRLAASREGEVVRADLVFASAEGAAVAKALHGASTLAARAKVTQGRLLVTLDPAGGERLAALAAPAGPTPNRALAAALAETRGREALIYQDLWAVVRFGTRALPVYTGAGGRELGGESTRFVGGIAGLIGLAQLPMPVYASIAGGDELTTELRVPLLALKSVGTLLGMFGFTPSRP